MPAATNRGRVALIKEVTLGTTPTTPRFRVQRVTSSDLAGTPQTGLSGELISDRQVGDLPLLGLQVGGSLGFEVSKAALEDTIESAMFANFVRQAERRNDRGTTEVTAVSATAYTTTGGTAFAPNQVILAEGFTNAANNGVFVAGAGSTATNVARAGMTIEASPPTTARLKVIGFQAPTAADIQAAISPNRLTATTTNFVTLGLVPGMWVKLGTALAADATSFAVQSMNGWARVSTVAAGALGLDRVPPGFVADAAAGKTLRVYTGDYVRNGVTPIGFTIEQANLDLTPVEYQFFRGMVVNQFDLNLQAQAILTGSAQYVGMAYGTAQAAIAGSVYEATPTGDVLNTSANVAQISEGGAVIAQNYALALTVSINNNLRGLPAIGFVGSIGVGAGRSIVSGQVTAYFDNSTLLAKVVNNTETALDFITRDAAGNGIVVDMPRVKYTTGGAPLPGTDQDVTVQLGYQALRHPTLGYQIHLQKFEAVLGG